MNIERIRNKIHAWKSALSPAEMQVLELVLADGYVTGATAMLNLGMSTNSLTKRISDLELKGFVFAREQRKNPTNGRKYTRYSLAA